MLNKKLKMLNKKTWHNTLPPQQAHWFRIILGFLTQYSIPTVIGVQHYIFNVTYIHDHKGCRWLDDIFQAVTMDHSCALALPAPDRPDQLNSYMSEGALRAMVSWKRWCQMMSDDRWYFPYVFPIDCICMYLIVLW